MRAGGLWFLECSALRSGKRPTSLKAAWLGTVCVFTVRWAVAVNGAIAAGRCGGTLTRWICVSPQALGSGGGLVQEGIVQCRWRRGGVIVAEHFLVCGDCFLVRWWREKSMECVLVVRAGGRRVREDSLSRWTASGERC